MISIRNYRYANLYVRKSEINMINTYDGNAFNNLLQHKMQINHFEASVHKLQHYTFLPELQIDVHAEMQVDIHLALQT